VTRSSQSAGIGIAPSMPSPAARSPAPGRQQPTCAASLEHVTDWTAEMPITSNVAWDGRLEAFKGRDTAHYIQTVHAQPPAARPASYLLARALRYP
jgi:hypothetical protein